MVKEDWVDVFKRVSLAAVLRMIGDTGVETGGIVRRLLLGVKARDDGG